MEFPKAERYTQEEAARLGEFAREKLQGELSEANHNQEDAQGAQYRTRKSYDDFAATSWPTVR